MTRIEYAAPVPSTSPRKLATLAVLLGLALAAGCGGGGAQSAMTPSLNKPIAMSLTRDDGTPAAIPVPGGRAAVLDFWSPTCEPCRRTIPAMLAKRGEIEKRGAVHVLVAVLDKDEPAENARAVLSLWGIQEPFLVDSGGALLAKVGARDVPAFAVVDAAGVLVWVAPDGITAADVLAAIP
jgi:thiol-disulfide isomerase/thioredoxin